MKLSKANLQVVRVIGTDKSDEVLHQVRVDPDGTTVASDGKAIMVVEPVDQERGARSMPEFEDETAPGGDGIGVTPDVIKETLKNLPRGSLALELGYAVLTECSEEKREVQLTTTDMRMNKAVAGRMVKKRFPEWRGVLRLAKRKAAHKVCLPRKALINLLEAMEAACPGGDSVVFVEFGETMQDGVLFRSVAIETDQRVVGYMTPLDTEGEWLPLNEWERKATGRLLKVPIVKEEV